MLSRAPARDRSVAGKSKRGPFTPEMVSSRSGSEIWTEVFALRASVIREATEWELERVIEVNDEEFDRSPPSDKEALPMESSPDRADGSARCVNARTAVVELERTPLRK